PRPPAPPALPPGRPRAIVDLQTAAGTALVGRQWRYADAEVAEIHFVELGSPDDPLGPGTIPHRTYDVVAGPERELAAEDTLLRLANGRVCFNWYRNDVTIPERVGEPGPTGATVGFQVVIDDYAEAGVNGALTHTLG